MILITTSATADDANLPRTPLFLPLLHQLTRYVAARPSAVRNLACGEAIVVDLDDAEEMDAAYVLDPAGERHPLKRALSDGTLRGVFERTRVPGFYTVHLQNKSSENPPRVFAVNFPAIESDLTRVGADVIERLDDALDAQVTRDVEDVATLSVEVQTQRHFWPLIVALGLIFLFTEMVLARMMAQARGA